MPNQIGFQSKDTMFFFFFSDVALNFIRDPSPIHDCRGFELMETYSAKMALLTKVIKVFGSIEIQAVTLIALVCLQIKE